MKVIIVGCGKIGVGITFNLIKKGHQVIVIDSHPEAFDNLGKDFIGEKIVGIGFDRDILKKAKIDEVDAIVSCTSSDEANALIARIAKNVYKVPRVVARLYEPIKADIYHRLGIQTISTTNWGIERATEMLTYNQMDSVYEIGNGSVNVVRIEVPTLLVGHIVNEITAVGEIHVIAMSRNNKTFIPTTGTILEVGDILYVTVIISAVDKFKFMLGIS